MYLKETNSGFFLYEDKNSHELLIIPVYMDEDNKQYVEEVFDWMRTVRKSWSDRVLPKNPYRSNSKVCKSCPVRDTCFDPDKYGEGDVFIEPLRLK